MEFVIHIEDEIHEMLNHSARQNQNVAKIL